MMTKKKFTIIAAIFVITLIVVDFGLSVTTFTRASKSEKSNLASDVNFWMDANPNRGHVLFHPNFPSFGYLPKTIEVRIVYNTPYGKVIYSEKYDMINLLTLKTLFLHTMLTQDQTNFLLANNTFSPTLSIIPYEFGMKMNFAGYSTNLGTYQISY